MAIAFLLVYIVEQFYVNTFGIKDENDPWYQGNSIMLRNTLRFAEVSPKKKFKKNSKVHIYKNTLIAPSKIFC